jgi:hypothetical protein
MAEAKKRSRRKPGTPATAKYYSERTGKQLSRAELSRRKVEGGRGVKGVVTPLSGPSKASRFPLTKKKTGSPSTAGPGSKTKEAPEPKTKRALGGSPGGGGDRKKVGGEFTVTRPNGTTKTFPNTPDGKKAAIDLLTKGGVESKTNKATSTRMRELAR